jgi:hypothetical protein
MTTADGAPFDAGKVSALEHAVNNVSVLDTSTAGSHSTVALSAAGPRRRRDHGRHHRGRGGQTTGNRGIVRERRARLRLLTGSLIGAGCLVLASRLQPSEVSPFAEPSGTVAWIALVAGIAGIWLVPGLWLSTVIMRTGAGPAARLATRIGTTLTWYALVGPVIHLSADKAMVTPGGIVGVTVAATAAMCLGVALGLVRKPANPLLRVVMAALIGGICAQNLIWLSMWLFPDMNYEQIRRLDWLIVLACALLTTISVHSRPDLPVVRTAVHVRTVLISLGVVVVTAVVLLATGSRWSPAQVMPSAIGVEQVGAPPEADVAFALTAIGPDGPGLIRRAVFTASDDTGRPVPVRMRLVEDGTADTATLLVALDPEGWPELCERTVGGSLQGRPVKLTVRDQASGVLAQAVIPADWCAR